MASNSLNKKKMKYNLKKRDLSYFIEAKTDSKKLLIKEVKHLHHKIMFKIPIYEEEIENIANNPYLDLGGYNPYESFKDRVTKLKNLKNIKNLLIVKKC